MSLIAGMGVTKPRVPAYIRHTDLSDGTDMSSLAANDERTLAAPAKIIQPAWVRIAHWINAVAMILMIMSGWQIYNASPLFDFNSAISITLGVWLGGGLPWHFAGKGLLMVNGLVYFVFWFATGRCRRKL